MMLVRLSSKGQLVLPKAVRQALGLDEGSELRVRLVGRQIILERVDIEAESVVDDLYGKYADADLLGDLEREHREEVLRDGPIRHR